MLDTSNYTTTWHFDTLMHWDIFVLNIDAENCIFNFYQLLYNAVYI